MTVEGDAHQAVAGFGGTVQHSRQAVTLASGDQARLPHLTGILVDDAGGD